VDSHEPPDFRVYGRIFATLHPDGQRGVVMLTPVDQWEFLRAEAATFSPQAGHGAGRARRWCAWRLSTGSWLGEAMTLAWQRVADAEAKAAKQPVKPQASTSRSPRRRAQKRRAS
jgi:hypothetical protein